MSTETSMNRREFLRLGAIAGAGGMLLGGGGIEASAAGGAPAGDASAAAPLNVLFINADQYRFDALSCVGNPAVKTPNLDRLAREGVRFTLATTPCPMCVPARSAFHTGVDVIKSRCIAAFGNKHEWNFGEGSYDQHLARRGYHCEYHGRWHTSESLLDCYQNEVTLDFIAPYKAHLKEVLGEPPKPAKGQFVDYLSGHPYSPDAPDYELRKSLNNIPGNDCPGVEYGVSVLGAEHTYTAFVADRTIDAIKRCKDKPFSIGVGILHPHHPQYVAAPWSESVKPADMTLPETLHDKRLNTPWEKNNWQVDATEIEAMKLIQARYYQLVQEVDHHVGRILNTLDELGLAQNTLVIFNSDHGEFLGDHGLTQKFLSYQSSIRVPLIMRLPGKIAAGTVIDRPANLMDMPATIFDYCGYPCPKQDGLSLRPLIEGRSSDHPAWAYSEWDMGLPYHVFVNHDWKYVWTRQSKSMDMLYNLREDPNELNNLLGTNPDRGKWLGKASEIRTDMMAWMDRIAHPYLDQLKRSEIG